MGAGALGSLLGALLSRKNDVLLITRGSHLKAIKEEGLRIEGLIDDFFQIEAERHYPGGFDLILFTVKAYQTEEAKREIEKEYGGEMVLTLQNGVGIIDMLSNFDVLGGSTSMGATLIASGVVRYAGTGMTYIGEVSGKITDRIKKISSVFNDSGIRTEAVDNIIARRWVKAAINTVINSITSVFNVKNGMVFEDENLAEIAKCIADETQRVLEEMGIKENILRLSRDVVENTKENLSSMLQDIQRGRKTEADYIIKPFIKDSKCTNTLYHGVKFLEKMREYGH